MKVIVYTRPRIKAFFHALADSIDCFDDVKFMSDHKGEEEICIMSYYYQAKKDIKNNLAVPKNNFDFDGIVTRCRYLRSLDKARAISTAKAMCLGIERIVEKYQPDAIFGMVMDSYILDIIDQVMRTINSQYIGFLNNMINGYSRITSRGELIQLNDPSAQMIEKALNELSVKDYVPNMQKDFMWSTSPFLMYFTKYLKEKIKITYYFLKKKIDKDPDNFYYNTVASKSCMSCRKLDQIFFRQFEETDWLQKISDAKSKGKLIVYMPLQFYPECSVDYWGTIPHFAAFYSVVKKIIGNSYKNIIFLVKEHPSAMGLRKSEFYQQFSANEHVILTPFDIPSNEVIEKSDMVLTWTGSVGVEAIMRNKPLATFGEAYYDPGYGILQLQDELQLSNIESILIDYFGKASREKNTLKKDVIVHMLKGLIPGYVFPLDYNTKKNPPNSLQIKLLAKGINDVAISLLKNGSYQVRKGCV